MMMKYTPINKKEILKNTVFHFLNINVLNTRFEDNFIHYLVNETYKDYPYPSIGSKINKFFSTIFSTTELEHFAGCSLLDLKESNHIFDVSRMKETAELCLKWDCYPSYLRYLSNDKTIIKEYWSEKDQCYKSHNLGPSLSNQHRADYMLWKEASKKNVLVTINLNQ